MGVAHPSSRTFAHVLADVDVNVSVSGARSRYARKGKPR
ncbi:hypothetical protein A7982_12725 [Minicystis rosea]|nr:hypothetical protein A7982_12725 [Minicystis rosea]